MNFASDNVYGVHPRILAALTDANAGTAPSYAYDDWTKRAEARLCELFERQVRAFLVTTGTAANALALSALTPPHGAVICHAEAHIAVDECNAPELFTGGAKLIGLAGANGKITPQQIAAVLAGFIRAEHDPKPAAVSIANVTELGALYRPEEVRAIAETIHAKGMRLHMDGARFANAVAALGVTPAELTWKSGVDALSFGATKNGAMMLEAVVFFEEKLAEDFLYRRMRGGQLVSKGRYLGAQMLAYLEGGLWLETARRANGLAAMLGQALARSNRIRLAAPVEANEVFAFMPRVLADELLAKGAVFYEWPGEGFGKAPAGEAVYRFVLSFATPEEDVERLAAMLS
jgi:threonine aldolase